MTRFKIKKRYGRWIEELEHCNAIRVNNGIDGIHLIKKIKNSLPDNTLGVLRAGHNSFVLFNYTKKPPRKIEELRDYSIFDV